MKDPDIIKLNKDCPVADDCQDCLLFTECIKDEANAGMDRQEFLSTGELTGL